ncbi:ABC transporter substrate-binding protein [Cohnella endophytica]|uniref:ABC transporter substrate-binding protein n=1 Tax=Cohnella endophytica TaxID=2419778 RepID=UPI001313EFC4|nr:extracellular solute-binding protein [Cohnella endophytica]
MKKRSTSLLLLVGIVVSLLAGCGNKDNNSANGNASPSPSAEPSVSASASPSESTGDTEKKPEDYKGEITVWTWNNDYFKERVADFEATYPNVKVNLTTMGWGDYLTKFEATKASGGDLPDVALAESYWWGKMLGYKDIFLDLGTVGFNKEDLVASASEAVVNQEGKFVAIPEGLGVGAIWYRKDLAKQYLGTDDANELAAKLSTWDDFFKAGDTIKSQSGGKVFLTPNATDSIEALIGSLKTSGKSYVDGDMLTLDNMKPAFQYVEQGLKSGTIGKLEGPAADAAWSQGNVVFFPSAGWREGFIPNVDKDGKGRWGVMVPPGGSYFRGGTAELIVDKKDPAKAELAALFIKQSLYTEQGMKINFKYGNVSAVKSFVDNKVTNGVNEFYGVDLTALYYDWLSKMPPAKYGKNDSIIEDALKTQANAIQKAGITADAALSNAAKEIKDKASIQ